MLRPYKERGVVGWRTLSGVSEMILETARNRDNIHGVVNSTAIYLRKRRKKS